MIVETAKCYELTQREREFQKIAAIQGAILRAEASGFEATAASMREMLDTLIFEVSQHSGWDTCGTEYRRAEELLSSFSHE